jgi:hypothetical protein
MIPVTKKTIIGITGFKGAGKDTLANILDGSKGDAGLLQKIFSQGISRLTFAEPIYAMMEALLTSMGLDPKTTRENKEEIIPVLGVSRRTLLQTLGTEWGRKVIRAKIWIDIFESRSSRARHDIVMVTDLRFDNEGEHVHERQGIILRITQPGQVREDGHESEVGMSDHLIDIDIISDGSVQDLEKRVERIWELIWMFYRSKSLRTSIFPLRYHVKSGIEERIGVPVPTADSVEPVETDKYEVVKQTLQMLQDLGVVISHDRMIQLTTMLRNRGLMPQPGGMT